MKDEENIFALQALPADRRIKACLFTAYLITVIFDGAALRWKPKEPETHPEPYTRLHNLIRTTATHLLDADPATYAAFQAVIRTFRALKSAISALAEADRVLEDCHCPAFQRVLDKKDGIVEAARRHFAPFGFKP